MHSSSSSSSYAFEDHSHPPVNIDGIRPDMQKARSNFLRFHSQHDGLSAVNRLEQTVAHAPHPHPVVPLLPQRSLSDVGARRSAVLFPPLSAQQNPAAAHAHLQHRHQQHEDDQPVKQESESSFSTHNPPATREDPVLDTLADAHPDQHPLIHNTQHSISNQDGTYHAQPQSHAQMRTFKLFDKVSATTANGSSSPSYTFPHKQAPYPLNLSPAYAHISHPNQNMPPVDGPFPSAGTHHDHSNAESTTAFWDQFEQSYRKLSVSMETQDTSKPIKAASTRIVGKARPRAARKPRTTPAVAPQVAAIPYTPKYKPKMDDEQRRESVRAASRALRLRRKEHAEANLNRMIYFESRTKQLEQALRDYGISPESLVPEGHVDGRLAADIEAEIKAPWSKNNVHQILHLKKENSLLREQIVVIRNELRSYIQQHRPQHIKPFRDQAALAVHTPSTASTDMFPSIKHGLAASTASITAPSSIAADSPGWMWSIDLTHSGFGLSGTEQASTSTDSISERAICSSDL